MSVWYLFFKSPKTEKCAERTFLIIPTHPDRFISPVSADNLSYDSPESRVQSVMPSGPGGRLITVVKTQHGGCELVVNVSLLSLSTAGSEQEDFPECRAVLCHVGSVF